MAENRDDEQPGRSDRRRTAPSPGGGIRAGGRGIGNSHDGDDERHLKFDRFPASTFVLILSLLAMTLVDGALTLRLLDDHFEEANPVMRALLQRGPTSFVLGKYALTVFGLPFLLIYGQRRIFHPRLRVGHVLPFLVAMYVLLLIYQVGLIFTL